MTPGEPAAQTKTEAALEGEAYAERIRRTNERLALAVCAIFAITGLLPITEEENRTGVLLTAAVFLLLTVVWFRLVPPTALGDRRVVVFAILAHPAGGRHCGFTGETEQRATR